MKNKAFTLAETLIAMLILGIIAAIMIKNLKTDDHIEKTFIPKANKAIQVFDEAAVQLLDIDNPNCPMGEFIINNNTIGLLNDSGNAVNSQEAFNMLSQYIKFEKTGLNFCANSGYCADSTTIPAGRISGDTFVGFEVTSVSDCPDFYKPGQSEKITVVNDPITDIKPKCWAKLYIDVNGADAPNVEGQDIFVLGVDRKGIHY